MFLIRISILFMSTLLASGVLGGELHYAANAGDLEAMRRALEAGADIDEVGEALGETPLFKAVRGSEAHAVRFLLEHGADPYVLNPEGQTVLRFAIGRERKKSATVLLEMGVKPQTLHTAAYAGDVTVLKELIEAGQDVNEGVVWAPLSYAVTMGHLDAAELLVQKGAALNKVPWGVDEPLFLAVSNGHYEIAEMLLRCGRDVDLAGHHGTVLHMIVVRGKIEGVKFLLMHDAEVNTITKRRSTPLHSAISGGHTEIAALLLDHGVDTSVEDRYEHDAMLHAVTRGEDEIVLELHSRGVKLEPKTYKERNLLHNAVLVGRKDLVLKLLSKGRDITGRKDNGNLTPLEVAARYGKVEMAEFLFANANIDLRGRDHSRVMQCAVRSGCAAMVELLAKRGASVKSEHSRRENLPELAIKEKHPEVLRMLIKQGALTTPLGTRPPLLNLAVREECEGAVRVLLEAGVKVNVTNKYSGTPLLKAVESGNVEIVRALLEHGADVNILSRWNTMIHEAVRTGNCELVELLIEHGVRVDAVPKGTQYPVMERIKYFFRFKKRPKAQIYPSALHFAIVKDDREMVKILLENGANLKALNADGESALEYASRAGSEKMNELILSYKRAAARKKSVRLLGGGLVCGVLLLLYFKTRRREVGDSKRRELGV